MTTSLSELPCSILKGVGPKLTESLSESGIKTLEDLLFHLPLRYQDKTRVTPIGDLLPGHYAVVEAFIDGVRVQFGRKPSLICTLVDEQGDKLSIRLFHFNKSQKSNLTVGKRIWVYGQVRQWAKQKEMIHPEYRVLEDDLPLTMEDHLSAIYPQLAGLSSRGVTKLIYQALDYLKTHSINEWLENYLDDPELPSLKEALFLMHQPNPDISVDQLNNPSHPARVRLALEELIAQRLGLRYVRRHKVVQKADPLKGNHKVLQEFIGSLPFELTEAQQRAIDDVLTDLTQEVPMMRLVQGDVGSGKTIVSIVASLFALTAGKQVAVMAPTEILAEQLFSQYKALLSEYSVDFLVGSLKRSERNIILEDLVTGKTNLIVGTHALFQDEVKFHSLGFVIIDEQHRFGVKQRLMLQQKGQVDNKMPHQLVMTATPIPRSLAMTAYADLELSIINELPPGRMPIQTIVIDNAKRAQVVERIKHIIEAGQQVYWVCTLIEESEAMQCKAATVTTELLQTELPNISIALVHGQMKAQEKDAVMQSFKASDISLLVATTVIEVGVNVPNASLMVIENPERLGLSQLHQLRGRVGRGNLQSFCVLLYQSPLNEIAKRRLEIMRQTTDGFKIADEDLKIRGPGDFLGTQQTGVSQFKVASLVDHHHLLPKVKAVCKKIESEQPALIAKLVHRWYHEAEDYAKV